MKELANIVHKEVSRFCHEMAEQEYQGYAQAAWFEQNGAEQIEAKLTDERFVEWFERALELGYTLDDVQVKPYISTHGAWHGWTSFMVEIPIYGKYPSSFEKIRFADNSELPKSFVAPFIEREREEAEKEAALPVQREAELAAEKAAKEADRAAWIADHGSDYLQRATKLGYNCQRQYVTERAALELPDLDVDFDNRAQWSGRSCPSIEALDLVEALIEAGHKAEVVWLTGPMEAPIDEAGYPAPHEFESCEAVVVSDYLGKYALVKIL
jgi:hypothetical protein